MEGKHHRAKFDTSGAKRSDSVLWLVHSDVCGKISTHSLSVSGYFLTFTDDNTRYVGIHIKAQGSGVRTFSGVEGYG